MLYDPKTERLVNPSTSAAAVDDHDDSRRKPRGRYDTEEGESAGNRARKPDTSGWRSRQVVDRPKPAAKDDSDAVSDKSKTDRDREKAEYEEAIRRRREEMEEARDRHLKARQHEQEVLREARHKERSERPPRTKGVLFRFLENGELEQVLTDAEKLDRASKREQYLEQQRVMLEKISLRDQERRDRDRERRVEKPRDRDNRRRVGRGQEEEGDAGARRPPRNSRDRQAQTTANVLLDSELEGEFDGLDEEFGMIPVSAEFTEVKSRRVKLLEKKGQRDREPEGQQTRSDRRGKDSRKSGAVGGDGVANTGVLDSQDSKPAATALAPPRTAWNDPQATLEVLGVVHAASGDDAVHDESPPEANTEDAEVEAQEDRYPRSRRQGDREKKDRPNDKRKAKKVLDTTGRVSMKALKSALTQPAAQQHVLPQHEPHLDSPGASPAHASSLKSEPSPLEIRNHVVSMVESDRFRSDETNMDIQSMAVEAVTRRNPMSYPTFIPGVGLSNVNVQDSWQQPSANVDKYGMLLPTVPLPLSSSSDSSQLDQSGSWQNRQRAQTDLNLYGAVSGQSNSELGVGGWSLGAFSGFMPPMMSSTNSNSSWYAEITCIVNPLHFV